MKYLYTDNNSGNTYEWERDEPQYPLEGLALVATLNAVRGVWTLTEAATIGQVTEQELINEATAWAVAMNMNQE